MTKRELNAIEIIIDAEIQKAYNTIYKEQTNLLDACRKYENGKLSSRDLQNATKDLDKAFEINNTIMSVLININEAIHNI